MILECLEFEYKNEAEYRNAFYEMKQVSADEFEVGWGVNGNKNNPNRTYGGTNLYPMSAWQTKKEHIMEEKFFRMVRRWYAFKPDSYIEQGELQ